MQRIIDPTALASPPAPPALTGTTGYFGPAVPGISTATRLRYWYMNMIQEELMAILAMAGVAADESGTNFNQVAYAIELLMPPRRGVQTYTTAGSYSFTVPNGGVFETVGQVIVELWGGGSGSWASTTAIPGGGGSAGGYCKKLISVVPGNTLTVMIGAAGTGGTAAGPTAPTAGGTTTFTWGGGTIQASGGALNPLNSTSAPSFGNLGGAGSGGDENITGSDGQTGYLTQGGMGGASPRGGGSPNSGTTGRPGYFPGGGASGAGNPSATHYDGAAGASGCCVIRW